MPKTTLDLAFYIHVTENFTRKIYLKWEYVNWYLVKGKVLFIDFYRVRNNAL